MNLKDLETRGFCVINSFFTNDEIVRIANDYNKIPADSVNKNYKVKVPTLNTVSVVYDKLKSLAKDITCSTSIKVDIMTSEGSFADNRQINFTWHQEHEPYFMWQQLTDYIIFYIPIVKEKATVSGLNLLPFDNLEKLIPDHVDFLKSHGARRARIDYTSHTKTIDLVPFDNLSKLAPDHVDFLKTNNTTVDVSVYNKTIIYNEYEDTTLEIPENLESVKESPALLPGDLLVLRGNIFHKTQDTDTHRIALALRFTNGDHPIYKSIFESGGATKKRFMDNNSVRYKQMLEDFETKDYILAKDSSETSWGRRLDLYLLSKNTDK